MTIVDTDLRALCALAVELGALVAKPLSAREVVVDPRVRLKCLAPRCSSYGSNLMCPPHVCEPGEFAAALQRYTSAVIVQQRIPLTASDLKRRFRGKSLEQLGGSKAYNHALAESQNAFSAVLGRLESESLARGYRFATARGGGDCALCERCVAAEAAAGEPMADCRHPFAARPSMEALGIDVVRTAAAAGLTIRFPAEEPAWTGLLLVD